ncbi:hypothetical protein O6H91_01G067500 [Diphasiastrum complanatum]|uniref:Uncharacterized protein n=1 Tax=Diphasiastrum complanatum TaxID=34168 RepID=A0ACC2ES19_DIPCM|nr:hypothetical protein O6H91_01G067500 [Diphasiastrum complanatum]
MLNYVDRGVIASNGVNGAPGNYTCEVPETCAHGTGIQGDFKLSYFQDGVLSSAFMVGLLVASPVFAEFSKTYNPFRLIGVGLSVWTVATAGCGLSVDFWSITFFRMLVGVGEASFISLAAPYIDDNAPPDQRAAWLSIFYMCIPVGVALGYVFGGLVGSLVNWRAAFLAEACLMLPFAIFGFISHPINMKGNSKLHQSDHFEDKEKNGFVSLNSSLQDGRGVVADLKELFQNKIFVVNVLGYIAFNFVLGAYSYWGPKAGAAVYHMSDADILFGVVTIFCGIVGTVFGGVILDYVGSTITNTFKLLAVFTALGAIGCLSAFLSTSITFFILFLIVGEFFIFAVQGPVNYATLQCVPSNQRALSMAMSTVMIHVFGDVPSSPLVGVLQDTIQNWRLSALLLTSIYFIASIIWASGLLLQHTGVGKMLVESSEGETHSTHDSQQALLLPES